MWSRVLLVALFGIALACGEESGRPPADDLGTTVDAGVPDLGLDAGRDADPVDLGSDGGLLEDGGADDLGVGSDAAADVGTSDVGSMDAGFIDVGPSPDSGPIGPDPWVPAFAAASVYQTTVAPYGDPADVYYPTAQAGAPAAPYPAVVLLQGANVGRGNYSAVASLVARFGYVVIVPDHERTLLVITGLFPEVALLNASLATLEAESLRVGSPIQGLVDPTRSAVMGHSLGGAAGLEAIANECSNSLCTMGPYVRPASLRAGVFYGANRKPPLGNNIPVTANAGLPIMMIQGTVDGAALPASGLTTYQRIADPPKVYATLSGANHYNVTDTQSPAGAQPDQNAATLAQATGLDIIGRWAGTFLNAHVRDNLRAADRIYTGPIMPEPNLSLEREAPASGPEGSGSCTYDTLTFNVNRSGGGTLPVTAWVPNNGTAPYPVVIFNPGLQLSANEYQGRLQHLASWCYAVIANGTTYSPLTVTDEDWTQDILDIQSWVDAPNQPTLAGRLGPQRALLGHSAGAKNGFRAIQANPSAVDVVIAWDVAGQNPLAMAELSGVAGPVLLLGELFSGNNALLGQYCAPLDQNYEVYFDALPLNLPTLAVSLNEADHMSFLDSGSCGLPCNLCPDNTAGDPIEVGRKIRRYTLAWLQRYLRNDASFETYLYGAAMNQDVASGSVTVQQK